MLTRVSLTRVSLTQGTPPPPPPLCPPQHQLAHMTIVLSFPPPRSPKILDIFVVLLHFIKNRFDRPDNTFISFTPSRTLILLKIVKDHSPMGRK